MIKAVFFDVNETLLDMALLKGKFNKYFDDQFVFKYWFAKLLHTSTVVGSIGEYKNFGELARVVLASVFNENDQELTNEIADDILGTFRNLHAHLDVEEALQILRDHEIRVIPVSNSSLDMMKEQLSYSGIMTLTDAYYSVDAVSQYKPFRDIYEYVAVHEELSVDEIVMVACHDWDLLGAQQAGLKTAYIKRDPVIYNPFYGQADIVSDDLVLLVKNIIKMNDL